MTPAEKFKAETIKLISKAVNLSEKQIEGLLEKPPEGIDADLAFPCFSLAKQSGKAPVLIAYDIEKSCKPRGFIKQVRATGPYVNFYADWDELGQEILKQIIAEKSRYGSSNIGKGKKVIVEYSSPNIAKPMSVGHLRSTVIGQSIFNILDFLGYSCMSINHIGDWGTQFGKLLYAYKKWGSAKLRKNPIEELFLLYQRFHKEAEKKPELEEEARKCFKRLEEGDKEFTMLWKSFTNSSLAEFNKIYKILGVRFDHITGESFYLTLAKDVIKEAGQKGVSKESKGAVIIEVNNLSPLIIQKSDEATVYGTRDLACIKYRKKKFNPDKILYVVGSEQNMYFSQLFMAAEKLGYAKKEELVHISFGLMSLKEGKISTRAGRVVFLEDVIDKTLELAGKIIREKGLSANKRELARQVGIGVIKYNDISRDRIKDVVFDWDSMLSFDGDTAPYIQYTHARANSILLKGRVKAAGAFNAGLLKDEKEKHIIKLLMEFPRVVQDAARDYKPHYIANYVYDLANKFNEFYQSIPVLKAPSELRKARLALVIATKIVIANALSLLGIESPGKM